MSEHIRWTRVALEAFVIVGSILLAFAIDAWWAERQEREAERDYLGRIHRDLENSRENIVEHAAHYEVIIRHGEAVLPILDGSNPVPDDTLGFLTSVIQVTRMAEPVVSRGAYSDLLSTGNLRIIRSDEVRNALSEFYTAVEYELRPFDYQLDKIPYREAVRGLIPASIQVAIRDHCLESAPLECASASGPRFEGLGGVTEALVAEPDLERKLNLALQALAIRPGTTLRQGPVGAGYGVVVEEIDSLLTLIQDELGS